MARESERPHSPEPPQPRAVEEQKEHFGPLELLRTRKADGRALLLFSRRAGAGDDERV